MPIIYQKNKEVFDKKIALLKLTTFLEKFAIKFGDLIVTILNLNAIFRFYLNKKLLLLQFLNLNIIFSTLHITQKK